MERHIVSPRNYAQAIDAVQGLKHSCHVSIYPLTMPSNIVMEHSSCLPKCGLGAKLVPLCKNVEW